MVRNLQRRHGYMPSDPKRESDRRDWETGFQRKSILLVEPNVALARLTVRLLRPHQVLVAPSIPIADEIIDHYDIDTVVFDPISPDGFDFLLRIARELPRVRRVVYSQSHEAQAQQAYGLAHAILEKPADDPSLRAAVLGSEAG
jgi:CheY-like chemotaxis protein